MSRGKYVNKLALGSFQKMKLGGIDPLENLGGPHLLKLSVPKEVVQFPIPPHLLNKKSLLLLEKDK